MDLKLVSRDRFVAYKAKYSMNVITDQDVEINNVKTIYSSLEQIVRKNIIVKCKRIGYEGPSEQKKFTTL